MKNCALFLICISFLFPMKSFSNYVQDTTKTKHEFAVSYVKSTYKSVNFNYSRRISKKLWLNFGLDYSGNYISNRPIINVTYPSKSYSSASTFLVGLEHHKPIKSNFKFISGINLRLNTELSYIRIYNPSLPIKMQINTNVNLTYGLGATFGLYYNISENFSIGSSLNPIIFYNRRSDDISTANSFLISLTHVSFVCLRYQF